MSIDKEKQVQQISRSKANNLRLELNRPHERTSTQWPMFVCKNGCNREVSPLADRTRCQHCKQPLIRWRNYEVKQ